MIGRHTSTKTRSGFTVIELLVSTAVISVLVSLLVPAVQTAREAARQTQCRNNLRQLGLALHNFESTHQVFPASGWTKAGRTNPAGKYVSWRASILPFVEESTAFETYRFDQDWWHPDNVDVGTMPVSLFLCPSTPTHPGISQANAKSPRPAMSFEHPIARTDYEAIMGVRQAIDSARYQNKQLTRSVMHRNSNVRFADITDGSSNTIVLSECAARPFVYRRRNRASDSQNDQGFGWIDSESAFSLDGSSADGRVQGLGPELSPVPLNATNENEPYSFHQNGAMFVFADGHTAFLSESIDLRILAAMVTKAGGEVLP